MTTRPFLVVGPAGGQACGLGLAGTPLRSLLSAARRVAQSYEDLLLLGIDVGGTKVHGIVVDPTGVVRAELVEPTDGQDQERLLHQLAGLGSRLVADVTRRGARVVGAGVGVPGVVDAATGTVGLSPNAPGVVGADLHRRLEDRLGVPVQVDNDVNLAAAGECWLGAGRGEDNFVLLNLGTGIGAGLLLDGEIYRGRHGGAGELAHLPYDRSGHASPRRDGHFEQAVSPQAFVRRWNELDFQATRGPRTVDPRHVIASADGDPAARTALDEEVRLLTSALAVLNAVLEPGLVVLAGGLGRNPVLLGELTTAVATVGLPLTLRETELDGRGGVLGAALLGGVALL